MRPRLAGYTLTEMLVVIAIIGLISAVVIPQTIGQLGRAQSRAAKLQAQNVAAAWSCSPATTAASPRRGGAAGAGHPPGGMETWTGPYIRSADQLKDPWGQPYVYRSEGAASPSAPWARTARKGARRGSGRLRPLLRPCRDLPMRLVPLAAAASPPWR